MAIKVTGTTVINDSREVENIADVNRFIRTPEITSPTDGSTDQTVSINIEGSVYTPLFTADERLYREFQIDLDSGDFTSPERSDQINSDSYDIQPNLNPDTSYKARIRDVSINGTVSEWSEIISFDTTNVFVDTPTITVQGEPSNVDRQPQITTSSFSVSNGSDTHESTDWEIIRTTDSVVVFSSFNDSSNLTSIIPTADIFDDNTEYEFRARHRGVTYGTSDYGSKTATTKEELVPLNFGESYAGGFYMGITCVGTTEYYLIVAPKSSGECNGICWKDSNTTTSGTCSDTDGYANTYPALANSTHPAGNFAATRTIAGFSDWYLPAFNDLQTLYDNGAGAGSGDPLPSGEDFVTPSFGFYWSSTERDVCVACYFNFRFGGQSNGSSDVAPKTCSTGFDNAYARAVRREPI